MKLAHKNDGFKVYFDVVSGLKPMLTSKSGLTLELSRLNLVLNLTLPMHLGR